ncbi:uncharacterized protein N7459_003911 [Penicillium hispanicum]|uniref:uncharacterized protein n=1 Tax=Penicillium hispanicum TaxID=1080232 RepID=UPI00254204ED|nr:uncharacterized protein N7459_003911 [Penicillium hispanicum]KAJ5584111.1 hypothetical protein N7459_003911 [Penicillium hispanicum]
MPKRLRSGSQLHSPPAKRSRDAVTSPVDRLSLLSDELLLHILSFLPVSSLNICQRLSHRFHALSGDSELWKRQYYSQWVRPRARRLASTRRSTLPARTEYSPKVSTWLDHGHLAKEGKVTNWKRQYRLRHNWSHGLCRVTEVEFAQQPCPPVLVKLCCGIVYTADAAHGLRAWAAKDPTTCLAQTSFFDLPPASTVRPTALAVSELLEEQEVMVGFENGCFNRYTLNVQTYQLSLRSSHSGVSDGAITTMALSSPYLLMVSQHKILSLYTLQTRPDTIIDGAEPREIASLQADNMVAPITLSLRVSPLDITATIVYSFFHIGCGWCLGIQELRLDKSGQQLGSRLASTVDSQYGARPSYGRSPSVQRRHSATNDPMDGQQFAAPATPSIVHQQPPTSMSYSHPYLLTSHADNTLTMYLVVSNSTSLFVRGGQRLWGHTSSVSAVQVTNRGKAVSVSSRGEELRIWELETAIASLGSQRPLKEESSIQVSLGNKAREPSGQSLVRKHIRHGINTFEFDPSAPLELSYMHKCVGFDEERVLLLREKTVGTQLLECYDFT